MTVIRYVQMTDKDFWYSLDKHLPVGEFAKKVRDKQGYILEEAGEAIGLLRYGLFWDEVPFCTLLFITQTLQGKGYGRKLMTQWEKEMAAQGYDLLLTSTRVDEDAQHFYRKLGYKDCGGLLLDRPNDPQPMELFLAKRLI